MSSLTRPSSVVTSRAWSGSSHRPGSEAAFSSSARRSCRRSVPRNRAASARRSVSDASADGMSTRSGSPAPRRGPSGGAISVGAVAELELLVAPAPAGVVAPELLASDFTMGIWVSPSSANRLVTPTWLPFAPGRPGRPAAASSISAGVAAAKAAEMASSPWTGSSAAM